MACLIWRSSRKIAGLWRLGNGVWVGALGTWRWKQFWTVWQSGKWCEM